MTNLFISWFKSERESEYLTCLQKNAEIFDRIFILNETDKQPYSHHECKILNLPVNGRPTFRTFFNAINHITKDGEINVIANSDIWFENIIGPKVNECYALTRHEPTFFLNRSDSQDSWLFTGIIKIPYYCDFALGYPGCDNRIAYELKMAGYMVLNPSLSIKTHHVHKVATDHYKPGTKRILRPYLKIEPSSL